MKERIRFHVAYYWKSKGNYFIAKTLHRCSFGMKIAVFCASDWRFCMKVPRNIIIRYVLPIFLLLLLSISHVFAATPLVLYTDLASGPTTGGENNKGTYLSIFGKNFGSTLGDIVVTIGNVAVDHNISVGTSKGRSDIQQITVQVGSLSGLTQGVAYPVKVTVGGVESTSWTDSGAPVTFMPNPGKIIFVSTSGSDSTGTVNDITRPFRYVQNPAWPNPRAGGLGAASPGDVIVMRGGTWTDKSFENYFLKLRYITGSAPTGAIGTGPIAVIGYPGEDAYIYNTTSGGFSGAICGVNREGYPGDSSWITIANLRIRSDTWDGPVNLQVSGDYWRVVNNDLTDQIASPGIAKAGGVSGSTGKAWIYGNRIHDMYGNATDRETHGWYMDGGSSYLTDPYVEFAYNDISNINAGTCIQLYHQSGGNEDNVVIHHNRLSGCNKYGLNFAEQSGRGIRVYNNVIENVGTFGVRFNSTCPYNNPGEGCNSLYDFKFYHNTMYNIGTEAGRNYPAFGNEWGPIASGQVDIRHNIIFPSVNGRYGGVDGTGNMYRNLWYGKGTAPSADTAAINLDPLFVNAAGKDFSLQSSSPAIDSGTSSLLFYLANDYMFTSRPQGTARDIGAYEYISGYVRIPNPPIQLQIR